MNSVESRNPTLSQQKNAVENEHTDVKCAFYRTKHPDLDSNVEVNKNTIKEMILKVNETPSRAGSLSLKRIAIQETFASRKILQDFKNRLVHNDHKKLKLGNTDLEKELYMEAVSLNEALKDVNPLMIKFPPQQHPLPKITNYMSNENSCRETLISFLKEHKSSSRRMTLGDDRNYIPSTEKLSGVSLTVPRLKQSSQQLKEKLSPKINIPYPDGLTFGNSKKDRKPEEPIDTVNKKVLKVDKKDMFRGLQMNSQERTGRCFKHFREDQGGSKKLNRSPFGIIKKSNWL